MEGKINIQNSKNVIAGSTIYANYLHNGDIYNTPQLHLNQEWFEERLKISIKNLGERYSEKLNFDLPIALVFNGIARNQAFKNELKEKIKEVLSKNNDVIRTLKRSKALNENLSKNIQELESKSTEINNWHKSIKWEEGGSLQYEVINSIIDSLLKLVSEIQDIFYDLEVLEPTSTKNYESPKYNDEKYCIRQISTAGYQFERFLDFNIFQLAERPCLLLSGDGGHGKSHLLADVAKNHQSNGGFSILLLGQYFYKGEVWSEIFKQLGISTIHTKDELLTLLNDIGKASGKRLLFFIDALNEGEGKTIWKGQLSGFLEDFKRYSWLGVIVSVRSTFLSLVVPENLREDNNTLIHITHQGFRGYEYQASKRFFQYFGLQAPKIPLLTPEFTNPLFLLLFCKGLKKNGYTHIPEGMNGISKIIQFFFQGINKSLFDKFEFDLKINIANKCADSFAQSLTEQKQTLMNYESALLLLNNIVKTYFPFVQSCNILTELISEGLFKENVRYNRDNREAECVIEFNYERFGDYIITNLLVDKYIDPKNPSLAFKKNGNLSFVLESPDYYNEGIIEALSVILPEKIGKELFEVVPKKYYSTKSISRGFIKSLIWRREDTITEKSLEFIDVVQKNGFVNDYVEVMISVCSNDKHLINANHLHKILINKTLPKRDKIWTTFIHSDYSPQVDEEYEIGAIQRLVDWAWSDDDKSYLSKESIYLSAKTVTWFLASPNRFLRDASTKGLVYLLTNNLPVACRLIDDFKDVNDPYVLERLLAGCYGAIVKSELDSTSKDLAQKVFNTFFIHGEPPVHLLTRDYARGICEFAIHHKLEIIGNIALVYPPYKSVWEDPKMTAENCVKKYKIKNFKYDKATREERGQNNLVLSTSDDFYDFHKYEIGKTSEFSMQKIRAGQDYNDFYSTLTKKKKSWLNKVENIYKLSHEKRTNENDMFISIRNEMDDLIKHIFSESEMEYYFNVVKPYFIAQYPINNYNWSGKSEFDNNKMVVFIIERIFELGWTKELFGNFDSAYNGLDRRKAHIQGIGEKYRWIAYYECLARLSDNFMQGSIWSESKRNTSVLGAWQIHKRDIDPTITTKPIKIDSWKEYKKTWWFNIEYNNWNEFNWYRSEDDLPNIDKLMQVTDPDGKIWIMIEGYPHWINKIDGEDDSKYDYTKMEIWHHLRSYIIKKSDKSKFIKWAPKQRFYNNWMKESKESYQVFSREFYWSNPYKSEFDTKTAILDWQILSDRDEDKKCPCKGIVTADEYKWGTDKDASLGEDGRYSYFRPSMSLFNLLGLSFHTDYEFKDNAGEIVCIDPTGKQTGLSCLLIRKDKLIDTLDKENLEIVWTMIGEKQIINPMNHAPRLSFSGCCFFNKDNEVESSLAFEFW